MEEMLVYKASFAESNKCYIGITNNLPRRIKEHLSDAERGSDFHFHKAILNISAYRKVNTH